MGLSKSVRISRYLCRWVTQPLILIVIGLTQIGGCISPGSWQQETINVNITDALGQRYASKSKQTWVTACQSTNQDFAFGIAVPGTSMLTNATLTIPFWGVQSLDSNVSPIHQGHLRDQLLSSGNFTPGTDTIFYFQTSSPITFQIGDTLVGQIEYKNGHPEEGNLRIAGTLLDDLNNGLPLVDLEEFSDSISLNSTRYINKIFSDHLVDHDVIYGNNISILTGTPTPEDLLMDVYQPANDSLTERPLIVFLHSGFFLPIPFNGKPTGSRKDSAMVEMSKQLAMRGFVVATISYRVGWNPVATNNDAISGSFMNALYRGVQDARTAIRFFRKDATMSGNTYQIDTSNIIVGGIEAGGSIAMGVATLDKYSELNLPKFISSITNSSYVDTSMSGDLWGTNDRMLNNANHQGYSSDVSAVFTVGGSVLDSSWIEPGDIPMIALHSPSNQFNPHDHGLIVIHSGGGVPVMAVSGGQAIIRRNNYLGNQQILKESALLDRYSYVAAERNDSLEGYYPLFRPPGEYAQWEWWDTSHVNHAFGLTYNPEMSKEQALVNIDTILYYVCRRIPCVLGFTECKQLNDAVILETTSPVSVHIQIYPVPTSGKLNIHSEKPMEHIQLFDLRGNQMASWDRLSLQTTQLDLPDLPSGVYFLSVKLRNGSIFTRKLLHQ